MPEHNMSHCYRLTMEKFTPFAMHNFLWKIAVVKKSPVIKIACIVS